MFLVAGAAKKPDVFISNYRRTCFEPTATVSFVGKKPM